MEKYPPASGVICPAICILDRSGVMAHAGFPSEAQRVSMVLKPILTAWRISFSSAVGGSGGAAAEREDGGKKGGRPLFRGGPFHVMQDVGGSGGQRGSVPDEGVAAVGGMPVNRAGNAEDLPVPVPLPSAP